MKNRKNGDSGKIYIRENSDIASDCMKQIKYGDIDENYKVLTYNHAIILINTLLNAQYKSDKPIEPEIQKLIEELKKKNIMAEDGYIEGVKIGKIEKNRATEIANEVLSSLILLLILKMFEANFIYDKREICGTTLEPLLDVKYDNFKEVRHFKSLDLSFKEFNDLSKTYFAYNIYELLIKECEQYIEDVFLKKVIEMYPPMLYRLENNDEENIKNRIKKKIKERHFFIGIDRIINGYDDRCNEVVTILKKHTLIDSRLRWKKI